MANCRTCGAEISDDQSKNFGGQCPNCIRIAKVGSTAMKTNLSSQGIGCIVLGLLITIMALIFTPMALRIADGIPAFIGIAIGLIMLFLGICMKYGSKMD